MLHKNTKIVCTIGPASQDPKTLERMVKAGMNVVRLNFSHGSYSNFESIIKRIRAISKKLKTPIAIVQDLQGPKIRVGEMPSHGVALKKDATVILTTIHITGTAEKIPIQYQNLPNDVTKNDRILIDDGLIELKVTHVKDKEIFCRVINGGVVFKHKGINVSTASISANPLTIKDKKDLIFGLAHDVDYIALSFVKTAKNITELRELIRKNKGRAKIIAKIERHEAVKNLESIINEADGIMVARGDLGVEIAPEQVPLIQKRIIHLANLHGKPVITATQILQSMVENPRATRAEINDAANAVFDHSDALMLSNESATGKYPVEATHTLAKVAGSVEHYLKNHREFLQNKLFYENLPISYATCLHGTKLAMDIGATIIVAITNSGFTAEHIAKHRSYIPIVAFTEDRKVQQQLALVWGINHAVLTKIHPTRTKHSGVSLTNKRLVRSKTLLYAPEEVRKILLKHKLAKRGNKIVIISNASKEKKLISIITI